MSPTTTQGAGRPAAKAFRTISGPIPQGSPGVMAMDLAMGRRMGLKSMKVFTHNEDLIVDHLGKSLLDGLICWGELCEA